MKPKMKVLSRPRCRTCQGKDIARLGFSREKGGSEYVCLNQKCKTIFVVPTLRLQLGERRTR